MVTDFAQAFVTPLRPMNLARFLIYTALPVLPTAIVIGGMHFFADDQMLVLGITGVGAVLNILANMLMLSYFISIIYAALCDDPELPPFPTFGIAFKDTLTVYVVGFILMIPTIIAVFQFPQHIIWIFAAILLYTPMVPATIADEGRMAALNPITVGRNIVTHPIGYLFALIVLASPLVISIALIEPKILTSFGSPEAIKSLADLSSLNEENLSQKALIWGPIALLGFSYSQVVSAGILGVTMRH